MAARSQGAPTPRGELSVLTPFRLTFVLPPALAPGGSLSMHRMSAAEIARRTVEASRARIQRNLEGQWRNAVRLSLQGTAQGAGVAAPAALAAKADTSRRQAAADLFGQYADLGLVLNGRLEGKMNRTKNERCISSQFFSLASQCKGTFQPLFDFQFDVRTGGVVADRVHLDVDYDSKREFEASNNIQVYYQGLEDEILRRVDVGNVSFAVPASRFITAGIPANNFGVQAQAQVGALDFTGIFAQQKSNVVRGRTSTVGDQTVQPLDREIADRQAEWPGAQVQEGLPGPLHPPGSVGRQGRDHRERVLRGSYFSGE